MALDSTFAFAPSALVADIPATMEPESTTTKVGTVSPKSEKPAQELPVTGGSLTSSDKPRPPTFKFKEPTLLASSLALPFDLPDIGAGLRASLSQALEMAESAPQAAGRALQALGRVWPGGLASMAAAIRAMGAGAVRLAILAAEAISWPELMLAGLILGGPLAQPTADDTRPTDTLPLDDTQLKPMPQTAPQSRGTSLMRAPETFVPPVPIDVGDLPIGKQQIELAAHGQSSASAASATLSQATPLLTPINDALKQFYYAASGGLTARQAHKPQEQVKLIQGLYSQLQKVVANSNSSIAAVGSAAHSLQAIRDNPANSRFLFHDLSSAINDLKSKAGALGASRNVLKSLVASLGTWLEQAHTFVQGGSNVLPKPPSQLAATSTQGVEKAATDLAGAYARAQTALNAAAAAQASVKTASAGTLPTSSTQPATAPSYASVKTASSGTLDKAAPMATAPETIGWLNPVTRSFSPTKTSAGDVQVTAQWAATLPAGGGARLNMTVDPHTGMPTPDEAIGVPVTGVLYPTDDPNKVALVLNKAPGNMPGQKPEDPKTPKDQSGWMKKVIAGITGSVGLGIFIAQGVYGQHGAEEGKRVQSTTPDFKPADANAKKILANLSPSSTKDQKEAARKEIWRGYFEAANEKLDELEWNHVLNVPFLGGGKMFTPQDMKLIREAQNDFYERLDGTAIEASPARPRSPRLPGDTYKMDHANHVLEQVDDAASAQVRQIASKTTAKQDDPTPLPARFDVDGYVASHKSNISTPQGYRDAQAAIWRHHLQPVFKALGKVNGYAATEAKFLKFTNSWLQDSTKLDFRDLTMLPNNPFVQEKLATCISAAKLDLERLDQAMPSTDAKALKTVLAGSAAGGQPTANPTKPPVVSAQDAPRPATLDAKTALAKITAIIKDAGLTQPPSTATFAEIKFTPNMFFAAGERHTSKAIDRAIEKAKTLFEKITTTFERSATGNVRTDIDNVLKGLNQFVVEKLYAMQPEAEPDVAPSPEASSTLAPVQQTQTPSPTTVER
jgi:hypothetical protein